MLKFLTPAIGVIAAAPAHAVSIVSLHGGMGVPLFNSGADAILLFAGVAALTVVVAFRVLKRKAGKKQ